MQRTVALLEFGDPLFDAGFGLLKALHDLVVENARDSLQTLRRPSTGTRYLQVGDLGLRQPLAGRYEPRAEFVYLLGRQSPQTLHVHELFLFPKRLQLLFRFPQR
ncbi:MAG: hypothetical protein WBN23_11575, partial [Woeseia sp.]